MPDQLPDDRIHLRAERLSQKVQASDKNKALTDFLKGAASFLGAN